MNLEERLNIDLKASMKAKDKAAVRTIRSAKNAILTVKTDGSGTVITEDLEIKIIQKLIKSRQDSLEIYVKQDREDLAVTEREEIAVLERYLPEQMSEEELEKFITGLIESNGASGMKDMGRIMGLASKELAGKADGKTISSMVKAKLS